MLSACGGKNGIASTETNVQPAAAATPTATPEPTPTPTKVPNAQAELLDDRDKKTESPIGKFDFKNFSYPLPRGWQDSDGKDVELVNGKRPMEMSEEAKRIGMSYVTTKFFDATGDGQDEALVVLKIDTGGSAIPQLVYLFTWKNDQPELIWNFRTGDRADGGLKNIRVENGDLIVELFGQDRYIVGELDTAKITGDEEQLCCPSYFTQTHYKWNGNAFRLEGKRLTYSVADKSAPPIENMVEASEKQNGGKK
ncbi:MAG: hypothetical protein JSS81_29615 [Acidobacteria bacterium]|nr:hypothetical protein [Acidobacteriota bacterium]